MSDVPNGNRTHEPSVRELTAEFDGFKEVMDERDRLYKERHDANKEAVKTALDGQREKVEAAFDAAEKSANKTEKAQESYNVSHNDLLKKQDAMIPRHEFDATKTAWQEKFDGIKEELAALKIWRGEGIGGAVQRTEGRQQSQWTIDKLIVVAIAAIGWIILLFKLKP